MLYEKVQGNGSCHVWFSTSVKALVYIADTIILSLVYFSLYLKDKEGSENGFLWHFLLEDSPESCVGDPAIGKVSLGSENSLCRC